MLVDPFHGRLYFHIKALLGLITTLLTPPGDLHDGNGLSDASQPNGALSNIVFENVDYDLLTIGLLVDFPTF